LQGNEAYDIIDEQAFEDEQYDKHGRNTYGRAKSFFETKLQNQGLNTNQTHVDQHLVREITEFLKRESKRSKAAPRLNEMASGAKWARAREGALNLVRSKAAATMHGGAGVGVPPSPLARKELDIGKFPSLNEREEMEINEADLMAI